MRTLRSVPLALAMSMLAGVALAADDKKSGAKSPDGPGRDWSAIDTNKDGLISPEEMEAWLKANPGPLKAK